MSYRGTIWLAMLPDGGHVHVYDTFDPGVLKHGQRSQRRIEVMSPSQHLDLDEEVTEGAMWHWPPECPACSAVAVPVDALASGGASGVVPGIGDKLKGPWFGGYGEDKG